MINKISYLLAGLLLIASSLVAQVDKDALALNISKAEQANQQKLKDYVWKRRSDVFMESKLMLTTITEFSYLPDGKLETKIVDAETSIQKKPGLRGKAQANAVEDKVDYIEKSLALALQYAFMSKGEMVDFISKATITEKNGQLEAVADNVHVDGDRLLVKIDPITYLFTYKEFTSLLGKDKVEGKLNYEKFSSGTNHLSTTALLLPAQKINIDAKNQDYTIRVK